jgi:hypothetical protein
MLIDYRQGRLRPFAKGGYNRMVFRLFFPILLAFVLLTACRDELQTKEKVQEAVVERLKAHSGLELKDLDVTTTDVRFDKNKATATVAFHPKGDMSVNSGMTMKYNLEERDGKWVVTGVNNSGGSPLSTHPPVLPAPGDSLPAGHPSVSEPLKQ